MKSFYILFFKMINMMGKILKFSLFSLVYPFILFGMNYSLFFINYFPKDFIEFFCPWKYMKVKRWYSSWVDIYFYTTLKGIGLLLLFPISIFVLFYKIGKIESEKKEFK